MSSSGFKRSVDAGSGPAPTRTELAAVWPPNEEVARQAGHNPMSALRAIREKCLDCSGYQKMQVKLCETIACSLWPFRAGRHPYKKRPVTEGIRRKRGPGGTWMAAGAASPKTPPVDGDFQESEAAEAEGSFRAPRERA